MEKTLSPQAPPEERKAAVSRMLESWEDGRIKLYITACGLRFRRQRPQLFMEGDYIPLSTVGNKKDHVVAMARRHQGALLCVAPRLAAGLAGSDASLAALAASWQDTRLLLPPEIDSFSFTHLFTGETFQPIKGQGEPYLPVGEIFKDLPVALLYSSSENTKP
jgi:(1->4)-alpha-D-glucan 1-alpha-D-glucosylmutase